MHIEIVEPHQRYYEALNEFVPNYVQLIEAKSIQENIKTIAGNLPTSSSNVNSEKLLNNVTNWLANNKA
jgi:hypothetical protein